ncbi:cytochrome P450 [Algicola sagamiensis]|uniref:cytochrome P450 n=1 Tax=Algicola sagamiensis TaxID=163869 RepID=UPI00036D0EF7|nr:cytochrome P450 [Algicola sagamiensis]
MKSEIQDKKIRLRDHYQGIEMVTEVEKANEILRYDNRHFQKGPGTELVKMLAGEGLLVSSGALWKKQRKAVQRYFKSDENGFFSTSIRQSTQEILGNLKSNDEPFSISPLSLTTHYTLDVFLRALFGVEFLNIQDPDNPMNWLLEAQDRDLNFAKRFRALRASILPILERKVLSFTTDGPNDLCDVVLFAYLKEQNSDDLTPVLDQMMNLLIGGIETSSYSLVAALYHLAKDPELVADIRQQVGEAGHQKCPYYQGENKGLFQEQLLEDHLASFIFEVLRLYPPVWILPRTKMDTAPEQFSEAHVWISVFDLHRDATHWENEHEFSPSRFSYFKGNKPHYMPFGKGPRQCVAKNLALAEIYAFLEMIVRHFDLELPENTHASIDAKVNLLLHFETLNLIPRVSCE